MIIYFFNLNKKKSIGALIIFGLYVKFRSIFKWVLSIKSYGCGWVLLVQTNAYVLQSRLLTLPRHLLLFAVSVSVLVHSC